MIFRILDVSMTPKPMFNFGNSKLRKIIQDKQNLFGGNIMFENLEILDIEMKHWEKTRAGNS